MSCQITACVKSGSFAGQSVCLVLSLSLLLLPETIICRNAQASSARLILARTLPLQSQSQTAPAATVLELGKPIERELAGGQSHSYQITLTEGQFVSVVVEQRGIDVVVRVLGPNDKQLSEIDSEARSLGQEPVSLVAEMAGNYQLNVVAKQQNAPAGRYEVRVAELHAATEKDRALQEARALKADFLRLYRTAKYDEARLLGERLLAIMEKEVGPEHPDVADALNNLANAYFVQGEFRKMEAAAQRALFIREKAFGPNHLKVALSLNNLAVLHHTRGEYEKVEPLFQRVIAIRDQALGVEHPEVADALNNLAVLYTIRSEYAKAEPLYRRALSIREKAMGLEHPTVATALNNLANLYRDRGEYLRAEELHQRALSIREKALGPEHPDVAQSLNNLAIVYYAISEYVKAEPLHQRALAIKEKTLGKEHPAVADSLNNLALLFRDTGELEKAEQFYQRALAIKEKALGVGHPVVADTLNNLAVLYQITGAYTKAEPLHLRALSIREKALGQAHPMVAYSLNNMASLYAAQSNATYAAKFQVRANMVSEGNLALNLAIGSERQKLAYLATLSAQANQTISLHVLSAPDHSTVRDLAVTTLLQRKGRVLDAMSDSLTALRNRFSAKDQTLLDQFNDANAHLARLVLNGPQRTTPAEHQKQIKEAEEQKEKLEDEISRRSAEFRAQAQPIRLEAVRAAIPVDAALIEFAVYRPFNAKAAKESEAYGEPRYVAYILRRAGEIEWKELGEAKVIDDAVDRFRQALRDPNRKDVKELARAVDMRVMQPLRALLGETTRLLISPDGALNLIPFAALVDERGRYLVERYSFNYLTSGRDLLRLQVARENRSAPLVVADPAFGEPELTAPTPKPSARSRTRQSVTTVSDLARAYFGPLSNSAEEAQKIKSMFPQAALLTGALATKAALKQVAAPQILHIATHGFFLEDQPIKIAGTRSADNMQALRAVANIENPLLRSGLALAGANLRQSGKDDGILTAMEVAGLNLWGTKLVVLSACDTGVGEVKNGEGVYGLRRALVLAGAETQVMSLWKVSDSATQKLMTAYYRGLKQGQGRGEALRQAQLKMLSGSQHPFFWAGFIQSGEWAGLDGRR